MPTTTIVFYFCDESFMFYLIHANLTAQRLVDVNLNYRQVFRSGSESVRLDVPGYNYVQFSSLHACMGGEKITNLVAAANKIEPWPPSRHLSVIR